MLSCNQKKKKYISKKYLPHNKFFYLFQIIGSASNFTNVERSETLFEIVKWAERHFCPLLLLADKSGSGFGAKRPINVDNPSETKKASNANLLLTTHNGFRIIKILHNTNLNKQSNFKDKIRKNHKNRWRFD